MSISYCPRPKTYLIPRQRDGFKKNLARFANKITFRNKGMKLIK